MLSFKGIQKTTLMDYPGEVACTLFLGGCNFRCFYCFNPDLVFDRDGGVNIPEDEIVDFLGERRKFLDGVCITGGEPLMCYPELNDFLITVKALGYKIKIDTNGSYPNALKEIIAKKLVDYIAMDIKGPIGKYEAVVRSPVDLKKIQESVELIKGSKLKYEFRTTVFSGMTKDDFIEIGNWLAGADKYCLQQGKIDRPMLDKLAAKEFSSPTLEYLSQIAQNLDKYFNEVVVRN